MTAKYEHIATITLDSSASSVTFSSIPQGYRDLELVFSGTVESTNTNIDLDVNGTGSSGSRVFMFVSGSSASSGTSSVLTIGFNGLTQSSTNLQNFDYSATDKHKTMLYRNDNTASGVSAQAQRWASTAAITSLELTPQNSRSMQTGSTLALYGIEA